MRRPPLAIAIAVILIALGHAATAAEPQKQQWTVEGVERDALVYVPDAARVTPSPLVFAFHGHGGNMNQAARSMPFHQRWPEAIVVYMQGLNTPGKLTDPEGKKPGWQNQPGMLGDRDLKFFDAVLTTLRKDLKVDDQRIYATGHSNGGGFTYLLWATRGDTLAAVAPSSALITGPGARMLKPKPVMHLAGEQDPLVKYAWQRLMIEQVKKLNGSPAEGKPWAKNCTLYEPTDPSGGAFVTCIDPAGTHKYPEEAPALIVKFFKEHPAK